AVDAHRDVDRADLLAARDDDVVQGERAHDLFAPADEARVEQRALLYGEAPGEDVGHGLVELVDRRHGEEAEAPQVHTEDRDVEGRESTRRAQHRAVAAEYERDLRPLDLLRDRA